eukprot:gene30212-35199_t
MVVSNQKGRNADGSKLSGNQFQIEQQLKELLQTEKKQQLEHQTEQHQHHHHDQDLEQVNCLQNLSRTLMSWNAYQSKVRQDIAWTKQEISIGYARYKQSSIFVGAKKPTGIGIGKPKSSPTHKDLRIPTRESVPDNDAR